MSALTDGDIDAILKDSRQCVAPGMGDVQRMVAQIRQLKAENAGLRTGYQAYERVNAELKAEVEGLRKAIADIDGALEREYWGEYAGLEETRAILDAALGQGEQS